MDLSQLSNLTLSELQTWLGVKVEEVEALRKLVKATAAKEEAEKKLLRLLAARQKKTKE